MIYAHFFKRYNDGVLRPILGSNGYQRLDGRKNIDNLVIDAKRWAYIRGFDGFEIRRGDHNIYAVLNSQVPI